MRKLLLSVLAVLLTFAGTAAAITGGEPDAGRHPQVGLVVFNDVDGNPLQRCSGTLLSPTVFLTAGRCTFGMASAQVWFNDDVDGTGYPLTGGVMGTPFTHPSFTGSPTLPNTNDVGVVVLHVPVVLPTYASLPPLGFLDGLARKKGKQELAITNVGYGLQQVVPNLQSEHVRYLSRSKIVNLRSALTDGFNVQAKADAGTGNLTGGTCFGDGGAPVFARDSLMIVGIASSYGQAAKCVGANLAYRADIANTQDFIDDFGVTP